MFDSPDGDKRIQQQRNGLDQDLWAVTDQSPTDHRTLCGFQECSSSSFSLPVSYFFNFSSFILFIASHISPFPFSLQQTGKSTSLMTELLWRMERLKIIVPYCSDQTLRTSAMLSFVFFWKQRYFYCLFLILL